MITLTLKLTDNNDGSVGIVITGTADHATTKDWEHSKWWRAIIGSSILAIRNQQIGLLMALLHYGKIANIPDDFAASLVLPETGSTTKAD